MRPRSLLTAALGMALTACSVGTSVVGGAVDGDAGADAVALFGDDDIGAFRPRDAIPIRNADVYCGGTAVSLERRHATVLLVIDRSGSMSGEGSDGVPKWASLLRVLHDVLPRVDADLELGLLVFPDVTGPTGMGAGNSCSVGNYLHVEPGRGRGAQVLGSLDAITPNGNTPTWAALDVARRWYRSVPDLLGERYVILATDGAPNCSPPPILPAECQCTMGSGMGCGRMGMPTPIQCLDGERTTSMIDALLAGGVGTYVLGLNGVQDYASILDGMAVAGGHPRAGSPRFYSANSSSELAEQFASVTSALVECRFTLDDAPPDPTLVDVRLDGISLVHDVRDIDGWNWSDAAYREIRFHGPTCAAVRAATGGSRLVAAFGCPAPVPP